jgi:glycosyltransferase involved in cell wall biosynthesis
MDGITINIPVYNEEEIITSNAEKLLDFMAQLNVPFEIIIVSNGSTDSTDDKGQSLQKNYAEIQFFSIPQKGVGKAFRVAAQNARYPHMISMDMDLAVSLDFIPRAHELLQNYHIVLGSKIIGSQKRSIIRKLAGGTYIYASKILLGLSFHDYSIGGKGYRTEFLKTHLNAIDDETNYVINLTYCAVKEGKRVIEIPVQCHDFRKSRFNLIHEGIYRYGMLFKTLLLGVEKR